MTCKLLDSLLCLQNNTDYSACCFASSSPAASKVVKLMLIVTSDDAHLHVQVLNIMTVLINTGIVAARL